MAIVYLRPFELSRKVFLSINVRTILQVPSLCCLYISDGMGYKYACIFFFGNYTVKKYLEGIF